MRLSLSVASVATLAVIFGWQAKPANAHSWYPRECCHDTDCAPVDSAVWLIPAGGGSPQLRVTSKYGTLIIPDGFPARESKDGRMHVCVGYDAFGDKTVLCFFTPPIM